MVTGPLTRTGLAQLLAGDEDSFTEYKSADVSNKDVAKELCAFLNADGGRLLLGVDDDGVPVGLGNWKEEDVMNIARTLIDPPARPTWQVLPVSGQDVAVVSVAQGAEKPYAVGGGESKHYYLRVGSTSRDASREELIRLTQASGAVRPDLRPVVGATVDDLDPETLATHFSGRKTLDWSALGPDERARVLTLAEILHKDTGTPTVAGLVCFGADPSIAMPQAVIRCAAYAGDRPASDLVDNAELTGPVSAVLREAAEFVRRNLRHSSAIEGVERVDAPRPSTTAIREVLANAVAHRDYSVSSAIQLRVFSDAIEVLSPGRPPNGVTPEAMRLGVSVARNPFIVTHLLQEGLVDALGRGVVLIIEDAAEQGLPEPVFEVVEDTFMRVRLRWGPDGPNGVANRPA